MSKSLGKLDGDDLCDVLSAELGRQGSPEAHFLAIVFDDGNAAFTGRYCCRECGLKALEHALDILRKLPPRAETTVPKRLSQ